jgi:hypothetical protein
MGAEIDDLMPRRAQVRDKLLLQTKSAVIRGNAKAHNFSPFTFDLSKFFRRRTICKDQGVLPPNPSSRNRPVAVAQTHKRIDFVAAGHQPQDTPGSI